MIDKEILDAVLPLPTLDELKEQKVEELKDEGFVISNFHSGGVFYTMLMIVLRIKVEVIELLRVVLNNMFVSHAGGAWLDLKMADYSKKRKKAQKTQGFVTVSRTDMTGEAVKIPKGHVFKSILDINGEELRFFVLEAATLQKGASSVDVLVEAETEGSRYNVPAGQIVRTLTYLGDVTFSNAEDWIVREGSDTEDDESARARTLRSWSELAQRATEDTFIDAAESVPGVLFAQADCNHPRGQGTVDVIVTGTAGEATEGLLAAVREAVDKIAGPYDNIVSEGHLVASTVMAQGGASGGGNPFPRAGTFAASEEFYHFGAYTIYQGFASDIEVGSKAAQGAKVYQRCSTSTRCSTNAKGGAAE